MLVIYNTHDSYQSEIFTLPYHWPTYHSHLLRYPYNPMWLDGITCCWLKNILNLSHVCMCVVGGFIITKTTPKNFYNYASYDEKCAKFSLCKRLSKSTF